MTCLLQRSHSCPLSFGGPNEKASVQALVHLLSVQPHRQPSSLVVLLSRDKVAGSLLGFVWNPFCQHYQESDYSQLPFFSMTSAGAKVLCCLLEATAVLGDTAGL